MGGILMTLTNIIISGSLETISAKATLDFCPPIDKKHILYITSVSVTLINIIQKF